MDSVEDIVESIRQFVSDLTAWISRVVQQHFQHTVLSSGDEEEVVAEGKVEQ